MIKLTDDEWAIIRMAIGRDLVDDIENRNIAKSFKVSIMIKKTLAKLISKKIFSFKRNSSFLKR